MNDPRVGLLLLCLIGLYFGIRAIRQSVRDRGQFSHLFPERDEK